jgi:hypothetical protein
VTLEYHAPRPWARRYDSGGDDHSDAPPDVTAAKGVTTPLKEDADGRDGFRYVDADTGSVLFRSDGKVHLTPHPMPYTLTPHPVPQTLNVLQSRTLHSTPEPRTLYPKP